MTIRITKRATQATAARVASLWRASMGASVSSFVSARSETTPPRGGAVRRLGAPFHEHHLAERNVRDRAELAFLGLARLPQDLDSGFPPLEHPADERASLTIAQDHDNEPSEPEPRDDGGRHELLRAKSHQSDDRGDGAQPRARARRSAPRRRAPQECDEMRADRRKAR